MVGKVFNEFLGYHNPEVAAREVRKSCKDGYVCVCVHMLSSHIKLSHWLKIKGHYS